MGSSMKECDFEVTQGGMTVASGTGPHDSAVSEAMHYAMTYGQDGPVSWIVYEVTHDTKGKRRRKVILRGSLAGVSIRTSLIQ